jgi:hypothetical protein
MVSLSSSKKNKIKKQKLTHNINVWTCSNKCILGAVPWFRQLVTGPSMQRSGFNHRAVSVGSVVNKVALGRAFL